MSGRHSVQIQASLIVVLFLGAIGAVSYNGLRATLDRHAEYRVKSELQTASDRLVAAGRDLLVGRSMEDLELRERANVELRSRAGRVLRDFPGVEGGYYVGGAVSGFVGYAFPTGRLEMPHRPGPATSPADPVRRHGDDPPPQESPFVLLQVQQSLDLAPGDFSVDARAVGPSRVAIVTRPVGADRPAGAAAWVMFRVSRPEDLAAQLFRYELSTGLALGGVALALVLTLNLLRVVKRQRAGESRLREESRRSEQLAALGKLLAGVAHEVRNPLAGIRSTVQLWERLPDRARTPESMRAVVSAVDRLNDIVTRLLFFSRSDSAERRPIDVNGLLLETLSLVEAQSKSQGVEITTNAGRVPRVDGAARPLGQVFLNLATNALQSMPGGGRLRCSTALAPTREVEVVFEDTGGGVPPGDRDHLFEPFYTTRPEGTGLGLALCREVVLQHGGKIELLASGPGGSTFRVLLPVSAGEGSRKEAAHADAR